jgi:hypothetical protein
VVEEPQVVMHEGDEPDALADLFDSDGLAGQGLAEADLFRLTQSLPQRVIVMALSWKRYSSAQMPMPVWGRGEVR